MGWIEVVRKNGKSELLAGCALYMTGRDGEESAVVYGVAADRDQARVVWDVAARMAQLSPVLARRLRVSNHERRIVDERTASFYTVLARDAAGNLGHNPHAVIMDEVISLRDGRLRGCRARRVPAGRRRPRPRPAQVHPYKRSRPGRRPVGLARLARRNPALGGFLSVQALRDEALEARNDPSKENAFRQFWLKQWVSMSTRWMPMALWDTCSGEPWPRPDWRVKPLAGREAWAGMDLSARHDLTSLAVLVPGGDGPADLLWRFWLPVDALPQLDEATSGAASQWARSGWLTMVPGAVIDYRDLCEQAAAGGGGAAS